jgi:hypothetical protein
MHRYNYAQKQYFREPRKNRTMHQPLTSSASVNAAQPTAVAETDTRLHGRWLVAARVGWIVLALTIVALNIIALPDAHAAQLPPEVILALIRAGFSPDLYHAITNAESLIAQAVFLATAALLCWRSADRMAIFGSFTLLIFGGIVGGGVFNTDTGGVTPSLAYSPVLRVVAELLVVVAQSSLIIFFFLFPSGRFAPRWTRWCVVLLVAYWSAVMVLAHSLFTGSLGFMIFVFFALALITQVYRYRRVSTPRERKQTKWVVFAIVTAVLIIVLPQLIVGLLPQDAQNALYNSSVAVNLLWSGRWIVALLLIPISIAVAILRSRLWDIDVIINKALVYGSLTALLVGIYVGLVVGMESLVGVFTHRADQPPAIIVISTLAIAALFQPLRRGVQRFIDRRFYRGKYDSAQTLAAFGATLRTETDLGELSDRLILAVQETMQPAHTSLWLRMPTHTARQVAGPLRP